MPDLDVGPGSLKTISLLLLLPISTLHFRVAFSVLLLLETPWWRKAPSNHPMVQQLQMQELKE